MTSRNARKSTIDPLFSSSTSTLDAPRRVVDLTTGLPSLTTLFAELRPVLEAGDVTILYLHMASNAIIEERFGWEALEAYMSLVNNYLSGFAQELRRDRNHCVVVRAFADDYVVLMPSTASDDRLNARITEGMSRHIHAIDEDVAALHEMYVGLTQLKPFPKFHPERLLYRGIQLAQTEATDVGRQKISQQTRILDRCIGRPSCFNIVYQPLVAIDDHSIFAYEGLVRCSQQELRNPHVLFNVAEQGGRIWPLSRLLRRKTVEPVTRMPDTSLLFINLHPADFEDPELLKPEPYIEQHAPRIVLEVTERAAIGDYDAFRKNIATLRDIGLRIAVDDLGSGYAALSAAAELDPEFIKFDMTLIRDIDQSPIRQNLLRNMVSFAVEAGSQVVAEGVETPQELEVLRELGCHFVQGYYLAKPAPPFTEIITPR